MGSKLKTFVACGLLLLSLSTGASEELLGYLFTTPAERENLDKVREQFKRGLYSEEVDKLQVQAGYKFNGIIRHNGKTQQFWLNGDKQNEAVKATRGGKYLVDTPAGRINIKPGQIYEPGTGKVIEAYNEGE